MPIFQCAQKNIGSYTFIAEISENVNEKYFKFIVWGWELLRFCLIDKSVKIYEILIKEIFGLNI